MRLIDADELLAQMIGMNDGWFDPRPAYDHESLIKIQPTVDAVPLDKLCEWLEKHACYDQTEDNGGNTRFSLDSCQWKIVLTKWMEEQDAAD